LECKNLNTAALPAPVASFHSPLDSESFAAANGIALSMQLLMQLGYSVLTNSLSSKILLFVAGIATYLIYAFYASDLISREGEDNKNTYFEANFNILHAPNCMKLNNDSICVKQTFLRNAAKTSLRMTTGPNESSIKSFADILEKNYKVITTQATSMTNFLKSAKQGTAIHKVYYERMHDNPGGRGSD
jgi:hypothetical protein